MRAEAWRTGAGGGKRANLGLTADAETQRKGEGGQESKRSIGGGNRRVVLRFESAEGAEKDLRRTERVGAERSYLGHRLTQMDTDKELRQEILTADAEPRKNK